MNTEKQSSGEDQPADATTRAKADYEAMLASFRTVELATVSPEGIPEASYAPALFADERCFYVYVSELSGHTRNLLETGKASVLVIEDESECENLFARRRATFDCTASEIERDTDPWHALMDRFGEKFGNTMNALRKMADFHLIRLRPHEGRLVLGFGQAYDIVGDRVDELTHVRGINGGGHRKESKKAAS
jgi:hypothetical protein